MISPTMKFPANGMALVAVSRTTSRMVKPRETRKSERMTLSPLVTATKMQERPMVE